MLGMMNSNSIDTVEFYASPSSTRHIAVGDISTFSQAKRRPNITYTTDGRRYVDGKLDAGQTHLEPNKTWDTMILNELAKKQMKMSESEIQRKNSTKKAVTALRKFLPFGSKSDSKSKASKADKTTPKTKSICPQNKCITVVE